MKNKFVTAVMVFALIFALCVPAAAVSAEDILGTYEAVSCFIDGAEYKCEGEYIRLDSEGTGSYYYVDREYPIEWEFDGTNFRFTDPDGFVFNGTCENGVIHGILSGKDEEELTYELSVASAPPAETRNNVGSGKQYVYDDYGLLNEDEAAALSAAAEEVSKKYNCGIYMAVVADYQDSGCLSLYEYGQNYYFDHGMGMGGEENGQLLILSMAERDYWLVAHGSIAHAAFTDYGKERLAEYFLDDFGDDDWYDGFADYVEKCGVFLEKSASGEPVDVDSESSGGGGTKFEWTSFLMIVIGFPVLIAFGVCFGIKRGMRSVFRAGEADEYVKPGSFNVDRSWDRYTHTTETRVKIENKSSSGSGGGTTVNSGGFSGSGGKF